MNPMKPMNELARVFNHALGILQERPRSLTAGKNKYKPHDGAQKTWKETHYLTSGERRQRALNSMISKGLKPRQIAPDKDIYIVGNQRKVPLFALMKAGYKPALKELVQPKKDPFAAFESL